MKKNWKLPKLVKLNISKTETSQGSKKDGRVETQGNGTDKTNARLAS